MIQSLAQNVTIGAAASETWTYAPSSFQKLILRLEDADWDDGTITVQIGSRTICNGVSAFGTIGLSTIQSGFSPNDASTNGFIVLDFGSHQLTANENLYVT